MSEYDFLIVGAGLYGATFARLATDDGYKCLVIDRRDHIAGNVYTEDVNGINVHKYGAHIFHTSDKEVWDFANRFAEFNRYTNCVVANYKGELYSMPFNMDTFNKMWGVVTPAEARAKLDEQIALGKVDEPKNLDELKHDILSARTELYKNKRNARKYCRFALEQHTIPFAPHLLFPQFMDDSIEAERNLSMRMNIILLTKCAELWAFGDRISKGMSIEIARARRKGQTIRFFSDDCKEVN